MLILSVLSILNEIEAISLGAPLEGRVLWPIIPSFRLSTLRRKSVLNVLSLQTELCHLEGGAHVGRVKLFFLSVSVQVFLVLCPSELSELLNCVLDLT